MPHVTPGILQNEFAASIYLFKVFTENILSVFSVMKELGEMEIKSKCSF